MRLHDLSVRTTGQAAYPGCESWLSLALHR